MSYFPGSTLEVTFQLPHRERGRPALSITLHVPPEGFDHFLQWAENRNWETERLREALGHLRIEVE